MSDQAPKDVIDEAKALTTDVLVALGETEWCVQMMALTGALAVMLLHVTDEERAEQLSILGQRYTCHTSHNLYDQRAQSGGSP